jgi:two-component system, response regulator
MNPPVILLVEDSDDDADLTARAFKEAKIGNPLVRAHDGVEALTYLRTAPTLPAVVLMDLKLPRLGGLETLARIRAEERTRFLPVVVLTSSDEDKDRLTAYAHHANSYVRKPVDYDQFVAASRQLGLYWTVTNRPPP